MKKILIVAFTLILFFLLATSCKTCHCPAFDDQITMKLLKTMDSANIFDQPDHEIPITLGRF